MIYFEQAELDSSPTIFLVKDNLSNYTTIHNWYNEDDKYEIYDDFNQTKLASSILDRWSK